MIEKNVYIVDIKNDVLRLLLEILEPCSDGIINNYYEVIFKISDNNYFYKVISINEINDSLQYIHSNFKEVDINEYKVDKKVTDYIIKKIRLKTIETKLNIKNLKVNDNFINNRDNSYLLVKDYSFYDNKYINNADFDSDYINNKNIIKNVLFTRKNKR